MPTVRRTALTLIAAGFLLSQLLWVSVIQPYGGIDEFDHAYRAASVARGQWQPSDVSSTHGRGNLVRVPRDIVQAAHGACAVLPYTKHDDCSPASKPDADGNVLVASAAASYNPIYYWIVGTVARPFSGAGALYAMRLATLLLCDLLLLGALVVTSRSRSLWPLAGFWLCATPMVLYSTTIVAPNGVQAAAAVLLWASFTAAAAAKWQRGTANLLFLGALASCVEVTVHSTGPLWLALCIPPLCLFAGGRWLAGATSQHRRVFLTLSGLVSLASLASIAWIISHGTNAVPGASTDTTPLSLAKLLAAPVLWALQTIAAIPFRNQPAPGLVYAVGVITFVGFLILGWLSASRRLRLASVFIGLCFFAVPLVLTIRTFDALGLAWQGRYALPLAFGLPFIAAHALESKRPATVSAYFVALCVVVGYGLMATIELIHVRDIEARLPANGGMPLPGPVELLIASVAASALIVCGIALLRRSRSSAPVGASLAVRAETVGAHD